MGNLPSGKDLQSQIWGRICSITPLAVSLYKLSEFTTSNRSQNIPLLMLNLLHVHGHLADSVHCMVCVLHCESLVHIPLGCVTGSGGSGFHEIRVAIYAYCGSGNPPALALSFAESTINSPWVQSPCFQTSPALSLKQSASGLPYFSLRHQPPLPAAPSPLPQPCP